MLAFSYSNDGFVAYARNASLMLDKDYWYLKNALKVDITIGNDLYEVSIPKGYLTDGASVPRILWSICPKWDKSHKAVILHDYLCEYRIVTINGKPTQISREEADRLFLFALKYEGLTKLKYSLMHGAVRAQATVKGSRFIEISKVKLQLEDEIRLELKDTCYK